jgi:serine/threonine protein kinase
MDVAARGTTQGGSSSFPLADRYRVIARVGLGGTAIVYRCVDLHTDRIVAVKVLRSNGPLIPEAAKRFRREALLAATLSNPHIVRVLDFGYTVPPAISPRSSWNDETDQPVPYLAMEYVYGSTLKALVRERGPLPLEWVWTIGAQLCGALAAAHAAGVVHRDVKPQNVLMVDSRLELLAKLTDFGIARQMGSDLTTLTATGQVIGTPDYLSPEQVIGEQGGALSDLYALGVVLYELITGRLPFEAETPLAAASKRMLVDPPPLTHFRPDVPPPVQEVVLAALRRDPAERYADAQDFAQALEWSRERAPAQPPVGRGNWLLAQRRHAPDVAPSAAPAGVEPAALPAAGDLLAGEHEDDGEELQPTVLRVVPLAPGVEPTEAVVADDALAGPPAGGGDAAEAASEVPNRAAAPDTTAP